MGTWLIVHRDGHYRRRSARVRWDEGERAARAREGWTPWRLGLELLCDVGRDRAQAGQIRGGCDFTVGAALVVTGVSPGEFQICEANASATTATAAAECVVLEQEQALQQGRYQFFVLFAENIEHE